MTFLHLIATPLAYLGAALGVAMVLPQLARTIRHPSLTGVSALSWGLSTLGALGWLAYGVRADEAPQLPGNLLMGAGSVAVVLLVPSAYSRTRRALILGAASALLIAMAVFVSPDTVGYVAFAIGLVSVWPQLIESYGNWRSGIESGLSLATWSLRLTSIACWLTYGLITGDNPVVISAIFGLATTMAVFGMEASLRMRGSGAIASADEPELARV